MLERDLGGTRAPSIGTAAPHPPGLWRWSPREGRWTPRHGYPANAAFLSMSTADFDAPDAYDAWRHHAYYTFDADPLPRAAARRFSAAVDGMLNAEGEFYRYRSHALSGRDAPGAGDGDAGDPLCLGLVVEGERRSEQAGDAALVARRGDFFVYDPRRPTALAWSRHQAMHLVLRRPALERALGGPLPRAGVTLAAIAASRMAPVLRDQFATVARRMGALDPEERSFLLDQTIRMVLFACGAAAERERDRGGLMATAMRLIERRLADPALSPDTLAHALGVSRATLYRAFGAEGPGVAEAIRDTRLERARSLLASGAVSRVGDAALAVGWLDTGNFARAFRARFGVLPSEVRETQGRRA